MWLRSHHNWICSWVRIHCSNSIFCVLAEIKININPGEEVNILETHWCQDFNTPVIEITTNKPYRTIGRGAEKMLDRIGEYLDWRIKKKRKDVSCDY